MQRDTDERATLEGCYSQYKTHDVRLHESLIRRSVDTKHDVWYKKILTGARMSRNKRDATTRERLPE